MVRVVCVRILGCLLGFLVSVNAAFRRICHGPHGTFSQSQQFWFPSPPSASTHFLLISRNLTTCSSSTCMLLCLNTWVFLFYMIVYTFSTCIYIFFIIFNFGFLKQYGERNYSNKLI